MNKKIIGILITMLLIDASVIITNASTNTTDTIYTITIGSYEIAKDENGLTKITMRTAGYGMLNSPGNPALPEQILEYQVPNTIDWNTLQVTINIKKSTQLEGTYTIAPCPPLETTIDITSDNSIFSSEEWGYEKIIVDNKNTAIYTKNSLYPEQPIKQLPYTEKKIPTDSGFELVKYLRFAYRPFQYNPITQELWVSEQAEIHISFCQNSVWKLSQAPLPLSTYDYVIVTTNAIEANSQRLQDFVHLKELYGHNVLVITEDEYGAVTGQSPNGRAEKIRQWLIDHDGSYAIDYVLLIGDLDPDDPLDPSDHVGDIPMKMCMPNYFGYDARNCPTDYFYADLSGNWDLDGDGYFGEDFDSTSSY